MNKFIDVEELDTNRRLSILISSILHLEDSPDHIRTVTIITLSDGSKILVGGRSSYYKRLIEQA